MSIKSASFFQSQAKNARAICNARAFRVNKPGRLRELRQKIRGRDDKDVLITPKP